MRENLPELITIHLCVNAKIPDQMVPDRFTPLSKYIIIICCILIVVAGSAAGHRAGPPDILLPGLQTGDMVKDCVPGYGAW